jgi:GTP-binding protein
MTLTSKQIVSLFAEVRFVAGASRIEQLPAEELEEFAFIGRSNVGKSSLINSIVGRKALARVSQNPGCTKQINFFKVRDQLMLVDLPGYGFAKISNHDRALWDQLIHHYISKRSLLKRVFILLDSRHPAKVVDKEVMSMLDAYGTPYQLVMTKVDKMTNRQQQEADIAQLIAIHPACYPEAIWTSSRDKTGLLQLQQIITG